MADTHLVTSRKITPTSPSRGFFVIIQIVNKFIWPILIIVSFFYILKINTNFQLINPVFWVVLISVAGGIVENINRLGIHKSIPLILSWGFAYFSLALGFMSSPYAGLESLLLDLLALIFALFGTIFMVVNLFRKNIKRIK